ncbi:transposase [Streptomyces sp. NPDC004533]|uniref:IS110 family transposase n=1 Tax=Streptomyces sp. NPDC004533 TaxID=3154278 RepID=UPI0033A00496
MPPRLGLAHDEFAAAGRHPRGVARQRREQWTLRLQVRVPTAPVPSGSTWSRVHVITIGIDPHKSSHTAVAVDAAGHQLAQRRFVVNAGTIRQLMRWCERWPERRFAVEGAKGLGRSLAQQLASAGEQIHPASRDHGAGQ